MPKIRQRPKSSRGKVYALLCQDYGPMPRMLDVPKRNKIEKLDEIESVDEIESEEKLKMWTKIKNIGRN